MDISKEGKDLDQIPEKLTQNVRSFLESTFSESPIRAEIGRFLLEKWTSSDDTPVTSENTESGHSQKVSLGAWEVFDHLQGLYQEAPENHPLRKYARLQFPLRQHKEAAATRDWLKKHLKGTVRKIEEAQKKTPGLPFRIQLKAAGIRTPVMFSVTWAGAYGEADVEPAIEGTSTTSAHEFGSALPAEPKATTQPRFHPAWLVLIPVVLLGVYGAMSLAKNTDPPELAFLTLEGGYLMGHSAKKEVLWSEKLPFAYDNSIYQQPSKKTSLFQVHDLDGDGSKEALFAYEYKDRGKENYELRCYASDGILLWTHPVGAPLKREDGAEFTGAYSASHLTVIDLDGDGFLEIVINSNHRPFYPHWMETLDYQGNRLAQYTIQGHMESFLFHDFDGDGKLEMLCGGTFNPLQCAYLMILDPLSVSGQPTLIGEDNAYAFSNLPFDPPLFQTLIPASDVSRYFKNRNHVVELFVEENQIRASVYETTSNPPARPETAHMIYYFTPELEFLDFSMYEYFWVLRKNMGEDGRLPVYERDTYEGLLRQKIQAMNSRHLP